MEGSTVAIVVVAGIAIVVGVIGLGYVSSLIKSVQEMKEEQQRWVETKFEAFREDLEGDLSQRVAKLRGETQNTLKTLKAEFQNETLDARAATQKSFHEINHELASLSARISDLALVVVPEAVAATAAPQPAAPAPAAPASPKPVPRRG